MPFSSIGWKALLIHELQESCWSFLRVGLYSRTVVKAVDRLSCDTFLEYPCLIQTLYNYIWFHRADARGLSKGTRKPSGQQISPLRPIRRMMPGASSTLILLIFSSYSTTLTVRLYIAWSCTVCHDLAGSPPYLFNKVVCSWYWCRFAKVAKFHITPKRPLYTVHLVAALVSRWKEEMYIETVVDSQSPLCVFPFVADQQSVEGSGE